MEIARADYDSDEARGLIEPLNAELSALYPEEGAGHFHLDPRKAVFLLARVGGVAVGCGAVKSDGEIKRMYVQPAHRGRGIARAILERLAEEARAMGCGRLVLETGVRQPAAIALYERAGFRRIPPFGDYVNSPLSVCMEKHL